MLIRTSLLAGAAFIASALAFSAPARAQIEVGPADLGGTVKSGAGPEAGVWVIAETTDLPTKLIKIVVPDDQGRYVLPELPRAKYSVWVRGYGLVDSPKVEAEPGKRLDLAAVAAPSAAAAADYYPAMYWYSMLEIPAKTEFPGTGPSGNHMPAHLKSQGQWLATIKTLGCNSCHQLGNKPTRTFPASLGTFDSSFEAWQHRLQVGPAAEIMVRTIGELDGQRAIKNFADWTDRIAAGELPKSKPPRPQGVERNLVVTIWDWAEPKNYLHDEIATDKRKPTVNAYGKLYGSTEDSTPDVPVLDPVKNERSSLHVPVRDANTPAGV